MRTLQRRLYQTYQRSVAGMLEILVWFCSRHPRFWKTVIPKGNKILILRTGDLGDLLVITPLFESLRILYPKAHIAVAVTPSAAACLQNNPHISEIITLRAPWGNHAHKPRFFLNPFSYLLFSKECRHLRTMKFDLGIDILGHPYGALLLLRAGIDYRMGMKGYIGGHTAMQKCAIFDPTMQVGQCALQFAQLLGLRRLPELRPQIFLNADEKDESLQLWRSIESETGRMVRIVIGPGAGVACNMWPEKYFMVLLNHLSKMSNTNLVLVGGHKEAALSKALAIHEPRVFNQTPTPTLRHVFMWSAAADMIICNQSMLIQVARALSKTTIVLLSDRYPSSSREKALWGYSDSCYFLGKEEGIRDRIYTPEEVADFVSGLANGFPKSNV